MRITYAPLSSIKPAPRNPKKHDLDALHDSFSRFGFVMPLLKNMTTGRLTVGHGRLEELQRAKEKGQEPPHNIKVQDGEWMVPVIEGVSFTDDTEAEAYLLADNHLVEVGGWTQTELGTVLKDLNEQNKLKGTGFTAEEVETLLNALDVDRMKSPEDFKEFDELISTEHRCPKCGYAWSGISS